MGIDSVSLCDGNPATINDIILSQVRNTKCSNIMVSLLKVHPKRTLTMRQFCVMYADPTEHEYERLVNDNIEVSHLAAASFPIAGN